MYLVRDLGEGPVGGDDIEVVVWKKEKNGRLKLPLATLGNQERGPKQEKRMC